MSTVNPPETVDAQEFPTDPPAAAGRRLPRWVIVVAGSVVLALVASGVVAATRDRSAGNHPSADGKPRDAAPRINVKDRDAAILTILKHRAAAVLAHDQRAWLADLDPKGTSFQHAQQTVFANLKQLDFASWSYEVVNSEFGATHLASRYDSPYILKPLLVHYAIKGYDLGPVARPQVLTFVQRGDRWYLASDSDVDNALPVSGHADPWDRRAMVSREGKSVLVLADAHDKGRLGKLVHAGDAAVARVAKMWPDGWRHKVVIVAVRDPRLIKTYFRTELQNSDDVVAIAARNYDRVLGWTPANSTSYDERPGAKPRSRIILNPLHFNPSSPGNANLLTHEIAHVATQGRTGGGGPEWLVEGAAEYTAYREYWPFRIRLPASLAKQVAKGSVYLPTYDFYQRHASANYLVGFLACAYIANHYGEPTLRRYYRQLAATSRVTETGDNTQRVTRKLLGLSTEQLQRRVAIFTTSFD